MASIDGAHYFLTVLAPIRDAAPGGTTSQAKAPMIALRDKLSRMPTAQQTPASTQSGRTSPFAGSLHTHFARFAVVSQLAFNGTQAADPVLSSIPLVNRLWFAKPGVRHDDLTSHYLFFAADFDAPSGSPERDRAVYLRELWGAMEDDLKEIFGHCDGFERVQTASDFIEYIKACEIETTMPFNWYWGEEPELPSLSWARLAGVPVLAGLAGGAAIVWLLWSLLDLSGWLAWPIAIIIGLVIAVRVLGSILSRAGDRPFPRAEDADLPTILKAMHIQQELTDFATANQALDPADLHRRFGEFLARVKPGEAEPRHPPGQVYASPQAMDARSREAAR